jgi:hypothetical protein
MTRRELLIVFDTLAWATDQIDNILGCGPDNEKYWFKVQRRAAKSFSIIKEELIKRELKIKKCNEKAKRDHRNGQNRTANRP